MVVVEVSGGSGGKETPRKMKEESKVRRQPNLACSIHGVCLAFLLPMVSQSVAGMIIHLLSTEQR